MAVKEFVFAQAAIVGRSSQQREIIDEIVGEAGMMVKKCDYEGSSSDNFS